MRIIFFRTTDDSAEDATPKIGRRTPEEEEVETKGEKAGKEVLEEESTTIFLPPQKETTTTTLTRTPWTSLGCRPTGVPGSEGVRSAAGHSAEDPRR